MAGQFIVLFYVPNFLQIVRGLSIVSDSLIPAGGVHIHNIPGPFQILSGVCVLPLGIGTSELAVAYSLFEPMLSAAFLHIRHQARSFSSALSCQRPSVLE